MAQCILNTMKRFSIPLNYVRLQSKCASYASFAAAAAEPKPIPAVRVESCNKYPKNKKLLLKKAADYENAVESVQLQENVVKYSQIDSSSSSDGGNYNPNQCSDEQLSIVFENLREYLPKLFVTVMDYTIYHPQLIFENNIQGKRTVGLSSYIYKISILRMIGHYKFAYVNMEILKMTKHPEDSTIKIRWRISGITGFSMVRQMWKFRVWKPTEMLDRKKVWIDGFSTMYVDGNGKIFKHVADKVMPDQNVEALEKSKNFTPLDAVPKMALIVGISPDISSAIFG